MLAMQYNAIMTKGMFQSSHYVVRGRDRNLRKQHYEDIKVVSTGYFARLIAC